MKTIKDVARLAGIGASTVSRYLNNNGYVSKRAKDKIDKALKELDYQPNALARAVRQQRTYTIGLVIPTISNQFFSEIAIAIEQNCIDRGYKTMLCITNDDEEKEKKYIDMILQNRFSGIILATGTYISERLENHIPIVLIDRIIDSSNTNIITVTGDHFGGAEEATRHLIKLGCKKLLHLCGPEKTEPAYLRKKAFEQVARDHCIDYKILVFNQLTPSQLQQLFQEQYDGVFTWNDVTAIQFISECHAQKIKIPKEIQIIGYDGIKMSELIYPKLTTVCQPINHLGRTASDVLINRIEGKKEKRQKVIFKNILVERGTTIKMGKVRGGERSE